jgi:hypothetical protein
MTVHSDLEAIRHSYKPKSIRVLFIGESPPAGGTFFYKGDSNLARYTQRAFTNVFGTSIGEGENFLRSFKELGCYLDDLCLQPVNHLSENQRQRYRDESVDGLAVRIQAASPEVVVVVMKRILPFVEQAAYQAGLAALPRIDLPFPAQGNQLRYVRELSLVLRDLQDTGILPVQLSR